MNIEELEKEAEEFEENYTIYEVAKRKDGTDYAKKTCRVTIKEAYLAGAEPREKRIAELERKLKVETELNNRLGVAYREYEELTKEQDEHLAELEKENKVLAQNLEDSEIIITGLEAQIEKMKCCENCKNYNNFYRHCEFDAKHSVECHCNNYKLWEIKEK